MKTKLKAMWDKVKSVVSSWVSPALYALIMIVTAVAIVAIVALVFVTAFVWAIAAASILPALIPATLLWGGWVYLGMGVEYFPHLDPVYLEVPFLHILAAVAVPVWFVRTLLGRGAKLQAANREAAKILAKLKAVKPK